MALETEIRRRRFTLDEYHRMIEADILHEDDRVELIRGDVVEMTPIGHRHAFTVAHLTQCFTERLAHRGAVWPQNPITILPDSEPQPDIVVLRGRLEEYRSRLPGAVDVALIVEVADTSLRYDRDVKGHLYAEAGVPEYWIVDLAGEAVEIYREPSRHGYRHTERMTRDGLIAVQAFADVVIQVSDILG
jgi:Uma2 family endonuclease